MNVNQRDAIIKTNILCESYVADRVTSHVIKNLNLSIMKKDFTVIMGASGSGKSTLLYMLSGMLNSTSGEVSFGRQTITGMKESQIAAFRRDTIGFVFQNINLVSDLTILENIVSPAYGTAITMKEAVKKAEGFIEKLDLKGQEKKYPEQLSGALRRRCRRKRKVCVLLP